LGNPIGFHFGRQNCSTFVRHVLKAANIDVPTEISLSELLHEIAPEWIAKVADFFSAVKAHTLTLIDRVISILPIRLKTALSTVASKISALVHRVIEAVVAIPLMPISIALGEASGKEAVAFVEPGKPRKPILPTLSNPKKWFTISKYNFNLPGVLQRWQRLQPSTVIYDKPLKLTIVPPDQG
jgi:hypothetical protein